MSETVKCAFCEQADADGTGLCRDCYAKWAATMRTVKRRPDGLFVPCRESEAEARVPGSTQEFRNTLVPATAGHMPPSHAIIGGKEFNARGFVPGEAGATSWPERSAKALEQVQRQIARDNVIKAADAFNQCFGEFPDMPCAWGEHLAALHDALAKCPGTRTHAMAEADRQLFAAEQEKMRAEPTWKASYVAADGTPISTGWHGKPQDIKADLERISKQMESATGYPTAHGYGPNGEFCPKCGMLIGHAHMPDCPTIDAQAQREPLPGEPGWDKVLSAAVDRLTGPDKFDEKADPLKLEGIRDFADHLCRGEADTPAVVTSPPPTPAPSRE